MANYMLLLHQGPGNMSDLPREKMMEIVKRYYTWSETMGKKGKLVGGEKLAAGGVRHIRVKDGKPVASDGPCAEDQRGDRRLLHHRCDGCGRGGSDRQGVPAPVEQRQLDRAQAGRCHDRRPGEGVRLSAPVHDLVAALARDSAHRLVAALARRLGAGRIVVAEDAVQHALLQALASWPFKGAPAKPEAWLATVAKKPRARLAARPESRQDVGRRTPSR